MKNIIKRTAKLLTIVVITSSVLMSIVMSWILKENAQML